MSIDEFFMVIKDRGITFQTWGNSACIRTNTSQCPICAVATVLGKNPNMYTNNAQLMGRAIGLSEEDIGTIAASADYYEESPEVRDRLKQFMIN